MRRKQAIWQGTARYMYGDIEEVDYARLLTGSGRS